MPMVKHSGGKVGKAAKDLTSYKTTKSQKSKVGEISKKHKDEKH